MDLEREPQFEDIWRVFDEVVAYTRELVGDSATFELEYLNHGRIGVFDVWPLNPRARHISLISEQFFIVTVGDEGGRWEVGYTDGDVDLVRQVIAATVAGRIEERSAVGRSQVVVTFEDGRVQRSVGYGGCLTLWSPQPGWKRWGKLRQYEPYHQ